MQPIRMPERPGARGATTATRRAAAGGRSPACRRGGSERAQRHRARRRRRVSFMSGRRDADHAMKTQGRPWPSRFQREPVSPQAAFARLRKEVPRDVRTGRDKRRAPRLEAFQKRCQSADARRSADDAQVQTHRHHPWPRSILRGEAIVGGEAVTRKILSVNKRAAGLEAHVVRVECIGHDKVVRPATGRV